MNNRDINIVSSLPVILLFINSETKGSSDVVIICYNGKKSIIIYFNDIIENVKLV